VGPCLNIPETKEGRFVEGKNVLGQGKIKEGGKEPSGKKKRWENYGFTRFIGKENSGKKEGEQRGSAGKVPRLEERYESVRGGKGTQARGTTRGEIEVP